MKAIENRRLLVLVCVIFLFRHYAQSGQPEKHDQQPGLPLNVLLSTSKDEYEQNEAITVTLVFSNSSPNGIAVFGPFMLRNHGVCGILSMDSHWCENAPAELEMTAQTTYKEFETPREIVIGPSQASTLNRVLIIPHGVKDVEINGKKVIDENGQWSKGIHRLKYSYVCSLFRSPDSVCKDPYTRTLRAVSLYEPCTSDWQNPG